MHLELIETSTFTRQMTALLSDEEYGEFQSRLAANPGFGALIKGGGGYARLAPKNVPADLTPRQVAQLAKVVKEEFSDES